MDDYDDLEDWNLPVTPAPRGGLQVGSSRRLLKMLMATWAVMFTVSLCVMSVVAVGCLTGVVVTTLQQMLGVYGGHFYGGLAGWTASITSLLWYAAAYQTFSEDVKKEIQANLQIEDVDQ